MTRCAITKMPINPAAMMIRPGSGGKGYAFNGGGGGTDRNSLFASATAAAVGVCGGSGDGAAMTGSVQ
jgi:hypothetical protein